MTPRPLNNIPAHCFYAVRSPLPIVSYLVRLVVSRGVLRREHT